MSSRPQPPARRTYAAARILKDARQRASGFDDPASRAVLHDVDEIAVRVASTDDLIRMKRAAGLPKDLLAIEELGALRAQLDRNGGHA